MGKLTYGKSFYANYQKSLFQITPQITQQREKGRGKEREKERERDKEIEKLISLQDKLRHIHLGLMIHKMSYMQVIGEVVL